MKEKLPEDIHEQEGAMHKKRGECRDFSFRVFSFLLFCLVPRIFVELCEETATATWQIKKETQFKLLNVHREEEI